MIKGITKINVISLFLCIIGLCSNAEAVRVNGQVINMDNQKDDEVYSVHYVVNPIYDSNISFKIEGDEITVGKLDKDHLLDHAATAWLEIAQAVHNPNYVAEKNIEIAKEASISFEKKHLMSLTNLSLISGDSVTFKETIAEIQKQVMIKAPKLKMDNFFLSSSTSKDVYFGLGLETKSWLADIIFTNRFTTVAFNYAFQGEIDFNIPSTNGGFFMAIGAEKITFRLKKV